MIKSISTPEDFLLHKFFGDNLTFSEGINVIYGPNCSGKSLLIDTLAHNTFIKNKGFSSLIDFGDTGFISSFYNFNINDYLLKKDFGKCILDWDGIACFKTTGILDKKTLRWKVSEIMCGCKNKEDISYEDMRKICEDKLSNGQSANLYIENLLNLTIPDLTINKSKSKYDTDYHNLVADYVSTKNLDGKPTLLIDEIDEFFDFDNLYQFWNDSIIKLAEKFQIIIVTHNPFFLKSDTMNIIGKEYYLKSMNLLKNSVI